MTDRPTKEVYNKTKRIIRLNTFNTVQGPTIKTPIVKQKVCRYYDPEQFETALNALKRNGEVAELNGELTLWDTNRLTAIQEQEVSKANANKELIGHINQIKAEL